MPFSIYVANLPPTISLEQLTTLFSEIGQLLEVKVLKGYGFLTFESKDAGLESMKRMNGYMVEDRRLAVTRTKPYGKISQVSPDITEYANKIADALGETEEQPRQQIERIVYFCGIDFARCIFEETLMVEESGGKMVVTGERRRTPGGVFFYLVRYRVSPHMRDVLFRQPQPGDESFVDYPPFNWQERLEIFKKLNQKKGEATSVKIKIVGRPGLVEHRRNMVVMTMEYTIKASGLPKGVPEPPTKPTYYTIYIAAKQWAKVESMLQDPDDLMILEGYCAYDPESKSIAVFTTTLTTKNIQAGRKEQQRSEASTAENAAAHEKSAAPPPKRKDPPKQPPAPRVSAQIPREALDEYEQLNQTLADAERRLEDIKAQPSNRQSGLFSAMQHVVKIKGQIAALVRKYPDLAK